MRDEMRICVLFLLFGLFTVEASSDMTAWWGCNEAGGTVLTDQTGNGNNGTIYGGTWVSGIEGTALNFNGVSDYAIVPDKPGLNFDVSLCFSISLWVKGAAQQVQDAGIINKGAATLEQYCIDASLGGYRFYVRNASAAVTMAMANVFPNNSWDHVAAVFDKSQGIMKIFVNGVLKSSQTPPTTLYRTADPVLLGNRKNIGSSVYNMPFKGALDNIRIYNRALSESEVTALYNDPFGPLAYPLLIPVPSPTTNRQPALFWHKVAQASAYMIQIDTTRLFTRPCIKTPLLDTTYKVPVDLPIDTIYWQVVAGINDSTMYYSEIGSFIIQDPRVPILIPYQPKITQERKPELAWHSVAGASTYTLEAATNSLFTNLILLAPMPDTHYVTQIVFPCGTIYWRVKTDLLDKWSITDTFQILTDTIPFLIRFNGATLSVKRPLFHWHPVVNAGGYRIEVASNRGFTQNLTTLPVADTFYVPLVDMTPGTWFWHVSCGRNFQLFSPLDSLVIPPPDGVIRGEKTAAVYQGIRIIAAGKYIQIIPGRAFAGRPDIRVYSISGKCMYRGNGDETGNGGMMVVKNVFPAGIYIVEVNDGGKHLKGKVLLRGN